MSDGHRHAGFALVELLIASALGILLIGGALSIYIAGSASYRVNEAMARVQETGNVALAIVSDDLRRAGYWQRVQETASIAGRRADPLTPLSVAFRPAKDCYTDYYINADVPVETAGEAQIGAANPFRGCIGDAMRRAGTDILVVRHAASTPTLPPAVQPGRLYVVSNFLGGALFVGGQALPAGYTAADTISEVETYAYYVNPASSGAATEPSLRRMRLSAGPAIDDEELVSGVEDLQVQLGIDADDDGAVDEYVSAGAPIADPQSVVAARVWLRVRADSPELGFKDGATYRYADVSMTPNDGFRRQLVSSTVNLRNARNTL
jgi:Tfp pilus assembly protein PilW